MVEFHSLKTRERYFTLLMGFQAFGMVFQNLFAIGILTEQFALEIFGWMIYRPWRLYILVGNSVLIVSTIGLMFLPESPMYDLAMGRRSEAMQTLQKMYSLNTRNSLEV